MQHRISHRVREVVSILPFADLIRYFAKCGLRLPEFYRNGNVNLALVDATLQKRLTVNYRGVRLVVDCREIDSLLVKDTPTFGLMRELYGRDVYLNPFNMSRIKFQTVIDLGANRGLFTIFAAMLAARVLSVELQSELYGPALAVLKRDNVPPGEIIEASGLVMGSDDARQFRSGVTDWSRRAAITAAILELPGSEKRPVTVLELIDRLELDRIGFMKMDIEGFEFSVMKDWDEWIARVNNIAMEVHRERRRPTRYRNVAGSTWLPRGHR